MTTPAPQPAPQPAYAWQQPPMVAAEVSTEPLEFHRLYRGIKNYRWWKPLVLIFLTGVFFLLFSLVIGVGYVIVMLVQNPDLFNSPTALEDGIMNLAVLDTQRPETVALGLLSVIVMIPSLWLAQLCLGIRPYGRGWSVALKIRWNLIFQTAVISLLAYGVIFGVSLLIDLIPGGEPAPTPVDIDMSKALVSLVFVLILVPFQAAAEEYVFRGGLMQVLGSWMKSPWLAILLSSFLFAIAHIYDIWGMTVVGFMGLAAAYLTWRTGGLEAATSIHVVNNYVAFAVMASGITGETAQVEDSAQGGFMGILGQIIGLIAYVIMVEIWFNRGVKKGKWHRTRIDQVVRMVPAHEVYGQQPQMAGPGAPAFPQGQPYPYGMPQQGVPPYGAPQQGAPQQGSPQQVMPAPPVRQVPPVDQSAPYAQPQQPGQPQYQQPAQQAQPQQPQQPENSQE